MASTDLVWPPYIRDNEAYENRKIFIHIVESPGYTKTVEQVKDLVMNAAEQAASAVGGDGDFKSIIRNLEESGKEIGNSSTVMTIVLPLPNELTDTQQHDWNTTKGIMGTALGGIENQSVRNIGSVVTEGAFGLASKIPVVGAGANAFGNMEVQNALGAMADASGMRKPLADPGYFQNYTGSQPRTFNMTFDLVPANPDEALTIMEIIMRLKQYSSPKVTAKGVSMLAPNYFDIDISNRWISGLASIQGVVLQNIVVNYGADGSMQQYPDGTPKYIQLGLTFVERKMRTAADFQKKLK